MSTFTLVHLQGLHNNDQGEMMCVLDELLECWEVHVCGLYIWSYISGWQPLLVPPGCIGQPT